MTISLKFNLLVFFGPSGSGKTSLVKKLLAEFHEHFSFSVSHTTRKKRVGEVDGREYFFVSEAVLKKNVEDHLFIETTKYAGNYYGTSIKAVKDIISSNKICVLDVDMNGIENIKKSTFQPFVVFIKPPSIVALKERLRLRGTESEEVIERRVAQANAEIEYGLTDGIADCIIVNDYFDEAYLNLKQIIEKTFNIS